MLNPTNICSNLEIKEIDIEEPFSEMYLLQKRLQLRLNPTCYDHIDLNTAITKTIYWFFCIAAEGKELLDWFKQDSDLDSTKLEQEIKMEAIDILHFVMNIGLELRLTAEDISGMEEIYPHKLIGIDRLKCEHAIKLLQNDCIDLIDTLPWKTWKTYDQFTIADYNSTIKPYFEKAYQHSLYLCNCVSLSRQDIINVYFAKNAENHTRQDNGY